MACRPMTCGSDKARLRRHSAQKSGFAFTILSRGLRRGYRIAKMVDEEQYHGAPTHDLRRGHDVT